jgi:predicted alpha/beta-hydrolase family hydrolase
MQRRRILLAPGASGTIERLRPHQRGLAERGLDVQLVQLPSGSAERAVPVYRAALAVEPTGPAPTIGGQSFGGRVASLVAADEPPAALVLISYPLHAPGRQASWEERTGHWPRIACPVLLLSGEADPFAQIELLQRAAARLPNAELVTYPGVGHGVGPVLDDALDRIAAFVRDHT